MEQKRDESRRGIPTPSSDASDIEAYRRYVEHMTELGASPLSEEDFRTVAVAARRAAALAPEALEKEVLDVLSSMPRIPDEGQDSPRSSES